MRYLIQYKDNPPFFTDYFILENVWTDDFWMCIYDLKDKKYYNGVEWLDIQEDHL